MESSQIKAPDYSGTSTVNLMASIVAYMGDRPPHPCVPYLDIDAASCVVLWILDGIGSDYLRTHHPESVLMQDWYKDLDSVFPSTTGAAIPSFLTAQTPGQHGLLGWHARLDGSDRIAAALPLCERATARRLDAKETASLMPQHGAFAPLSSQIASIMPQHISDSHLMHACFPSARHEGYTTLTQCVDVIGRCVRDGAQFVYAYWPTYDSTAHEYGFDSPQCARQIHNVDAAYARLRETLSNTGATVLTTADHGFVNISGRLRLDQYPDLYSLLRMPLWGDVRCAYVGVREGQQQAFYEQFSARFGEDFGIYSPQQLMDDGLFGPAEHPQLRQRLGDWVIIPRGSMSIGDQIPGEKPRHAIGEHSGNSRQECRVPLLRFDAS